MKIGIGSLVIHSRIQNNVKNQLIQLAWKCCKFLKIKGKINSTQRRLLLMISNKLH